MILTIVLAVYNYKMAKLGKERSYGLLGLAMGIDLIIYEKLIGALF